MDIGFATESGDGHKNEDLVVAQPSVAVVLDGLTAPAMLGTGCVHGTSWFVRKLGQQLLDHAADTEMPLTGALWRAIEGVASLHEQRCDLDHPGTPCSSVVMLRESSNTLDYLVLFDSALTVESTREPNPIVVCDDRVLQFAPTEREATRAHSIGTAGHRRAIEALVAAERRYRNQPNGYWVAGSKPSAAHQAVTGKFERSSVARAALLTDGAAALVDPYELATWSDLLDRLQMSGPRSAIEDVRKAERSDPTGTKWPRYKMSDDASIAFCIVTDADPMRADHG